MEMRSEAYVVPGTLSGEATSCGFLDSRGIPLFKEGRECLYAKPTALVFLVPGVPSAPSACAYAPNPVLHVAHRSEPKVLLIPVPRAEAVTQRGLFAMDSRSDAAGFHLHHPSKSGSTSYFGCLELGSSKKGSDQNKTHTCTFHWLVKCNAPGPLLQQILLDQLVQAAPEAIQFPTRVCNGRFLTAGQPKESVFNWFNTEAPRTCP